MLSQKAKAPLPEHGHITASSAKRPHAHTILRSYQASAVVLDPNEFQRVEVVVAPYAAA
jgi:hypothetical protein